jgi:predicted RNase H-like HicB family nuclease
MNEQEYTVHAFWDEEAEVWVAESSDVPGLATEASTLETLREKLRILIPELLSLNETANKPENASKTITYHLKTDFHETITA